MHIMTKFGMPHLTLKQKPRPDVVKDQSTGQHQQQQTLSTHTTINTSDRDPVTPQPLINPEWLSSIEVHRSNTPKQETWTAAPLTGIERDIFQRENTLKLAAVPPVPHDLPINRTMTTGLIYTRIFVREDYTALDSLDMLIRKHLMQHDGQSPRIAYVHADLYEKLCIEHYQTYHHPLNNTYRTFGAFHQEIELHIYAADVAGIDLPREVLICQ